MNCPLGFASEWSSNASYEQPCLELGHNHNSKVSILNVPNFKLNDTLNPLIENLGSLVEIRLGGNNLTGTISRHLTKLTSLKKIRCQWQQKDSVPVEIETDLAAYHIKGIISLLLMNK